MVALVVVGAAFFLRCFLCLLFVVLIAVTACGRPMILL